MLDESRLGFDTLAIHGGYAPDPATGASATPIFQTASYVFRDTQHAADVFSLQEPGFTYTRMMNPTQDAFEKRMALLEGGVAALATSSGLSAVTLAILNVAGAGDEVVSGSALYGGVYSLFSHTLPKMGITVRFVDPSDPENFRKAITKKTKAVYGEMVGNPRLTVLDVERVAEIAHEAFLPLIVDNTFPSPALVNPIRWGADIVLHSATKFIGGHGTSIGGVIVDGGLFDWSSGKFSTFTEPDPSYHGLIWMDLPESQRRMAFALKCRLELMRDMGACIAPLNAFLFLQGLATLPLRMERHSANAMRIAEFLATHPRVAWVNYPGLPDFPGHAVARRYHKNGHFGGMIGFGVRGGLEAGRRFIDSLQLFTHLANLGDVRSLVIHPASTTHQQLSEEEQRAAGVTPDFIRLSIGIEDADDLIADLDQALGKTAKKAA